MLVAFIENSIGPKIYNGAYVWANCKNKKDIHNFLILRKGEVEKTFRGLVLLRKVDGVFYPFV